MIAISIIKGIALISLLILASYKDLKYRQVSDCYSILLVILALIFPHPDWGWGIFCALPFLIAAICVGGMGGADIKMMGAAGMVLGFWGGIMVMIIGLTIMLFFHIGKIFLGAKKEEKVAYPLIPFLSIGIIYIYLIQQFY